MFRYRRFQTTIGGKTNIKEDFLKTFMVRQPLGKFDRLHPRAKRTFNKMIQEPLPLNYKLQEISEKQENMRYEFTKPLGGTDILPFQIMRTHTENLPVYTCFKQGRSIKETIVRNLNGDVEEFKRELSKIVSNSKITHKTGKVIVQGLHSDKIKFWLRRLGF